MGEHLAHKRLYEHVHLMSSVHALYGHCKARLMSALWVLYIPYMGIVCAEVARSLVTETTSSFEVVRTFISKK